jgi:hypothetical protein
MSLPPVVILTVAKDNQIKKARTGPTITSLEKLDHHIEEYFWPPGKADKRKAKGDRTT